MNQKTNEAGQTVPEAVATAFAHVKGLYPAVTQVSYDEDQRWLFSDPAGNAPDFGTDIDVGVLEDAADALLTFPIAYAMNAGEVLVVAHTDRELYVPGPHAVDPANALSLASPGTQPILARQVIHLPSAEGHGEYDLYALAPAGMPDDDAVNIINGEIRRANIEDSRNAAGGCDDGMSVEDSIKRGLSNLGFEVFKPKMTNCWDENPG